MLKKSIKKKRKKVSKLFQSIIVLFLFGLLVIASWFIFSKSNVCANTGSCIADLSGEYETGATTGVFHGVENIAPTLDKETVVVTNVLGDVSANIKRIEVDLTNQKLYAFEENKLIYEFPISSGKWGKTPTGDFKIWIKLRYTRMSGGNKALGTYYNLPNVPYTMFFYNDAIPKSRGYGIHGAYWHNNFGHPMSHGCINMKTEDVEKVYNWATPVSSTGTTYATDDNPGTPIKIYGSAALY